MEAGGAVQREQIEQALADQGGAYQRLRRIMDAWCALWFWPLTQESVQPPTMAEWIDALQMLLGRHQGKAKNQGGNQTLAAGTSWDELGDYESLDLGFASAMPIDLILARHPWLGVCEQVAAQQGFFHWELDFATIFAHGGFDLQVGNPPWVRPTADVDALLAEGDPWWQLAAKPSETLRAKKRVGTLALSGMPDLILTGTTDASAIAAFLGSSQQYALLAGVQTDLYRCFMEQTWRHSKAAGMVGLIHLESHFTDEKAGHLRSLTYRRLRRHWQFINELQLFEIQNQKTYGVNVYGSLCSSPSFLHATSLYHPDTVLRSLAHDGTGIEPGIKDPDGHWDVRPHQSRITNVTQQTLGIWHALVEDDNVPVTQTRMVYSVNRSTSEVLDKLARSPRLGHYDVQFSPGWQEKSDRAKGYFEAGWGAPDTWADVILQGPHLFVSTPIYKTPNVTMLNPLDWTPTDFERLATDGVPVTAYRRSVDSSAYDSAYSNWGSKGSPTSPRDHYRVAWRRMAANTGERTLIAALIPPGAAHVHPVSSLGMPDLPMNLLVQAAGFLSSILLDLAIRSVPKSDILFNTIKRLPFISEHGLSSHLTLRTLRLHCVTDAYAALWAGCDAAEFRHDEWTSEAHGRPKLSAHIGVPWTREALLRRAADRRQALLEIDAIVAIMLGLNAEDLCTVYRTQFPVLYGYDRNVSFYDANGRLVPNSVLTVWRRKGSSIPLEERTATNASGNTYVYELPYATLDREADMRQAYAHFSALLAERT